MKKILVSALAVVLAGTQFSFRSGGEMLPLGAQAPLTDYQMKGIDGQEHSLADLKEKNGLLVIFSCNTCPFVLAWEETFPSVEQWANDAEVGLVWVNSNTRKRDGEDSMAAMKEHAPEAGYQSPYVVDAQNKLADAFGAKTTPHVFLFDDDMTLVYRGSIDNKYENKSKVADKFYLQEALKQLAASEKINPDDTREIGCSIKRV